ncbi:hypothetical protein H6G81_20905 [Scytonema hofmannii FACHB-248]|uniref:CpcD n=1 Tax=Scytonema hofmannii FACHB-248 TaxID=1842502 RepID=A0ABR8GV24_9CYAN|nr:hypothetical protein [Scytonema hofmannii FACHB-248]
MSHSWYSSCSDRTLSKDELGYTVIYRVSIGNTGSVSANNLIFRDATRNFNKCRTYAKLRKNEPQRTQSSRRNEEEREFLRKS